LIKLHVPRPPPSDEQAVHHNVTCDMCHESPITGLRYKCTVCPDFDMCEKCEAKRLHPAEHPVIKLRTERQLPPQLPPFFQGDAARSGGGRCGRRGGGGGRCRRFMAAAAAAAAAASSATQAAAAASESKEEGCPMFARACGQSGANDVEPAAAAKTDVTGPQAVLVRHVTLAHGSKLEQGQVLVKTWSVQNNGSTVWPISSKLIFLRGDRELLGETEEFSIAAAKPDQTVEISVPITTPTKPGSYSAYFQLADGDRKVFGPRLWLEVLVTRDDEDERKLAPPAQPVSSNNSPSLSSTVAPVVDTSGWIDVKVETSPVMKPVLAPATLPAAPIVSLSPSLESVAKPVVKPVAIAPKPTATPSKYAAQLASLSSMGFNNSELNSFLLEKHNGDIQQVSNWLLENMQH